MLRPWIVNLKTPTLYAVTAEVTELNNEKNLKKTPCSQRTIIKQELPKEAKKRLKQLQVQKRVENYFSFNFYSKQRRLKR